MATHVRLERRYRLLPLEDVPVVVSEPWVTLEPFETAGAGAAQPLLRIPLQELREFVVSTESVPSSRLRAWTDIGCLCTHPLDAIQSFGTNDLLDVLREPDLLLQDGLREGRVRLASVRPLAKEELVCDDAEGPPVDRREVAAFGENFGGCADGKSDQLARLWTF